MCPRNRQLWMNLEIDKRHQAGKKEIKGAIDKSRRLESLRCKLAFVEGPRVRVIGELFTSRSIFYFFSSRNSWNNWNALRGINDCNSRDFWNNNFWKVGVVLPLTIIQTDNFFFFFFVANVMARSITKIFMKFQDLELSIEEKKKFKYSLWTTYEWE